MKPTLHLLWTSPNHKLQQVPNKPASLDGNEDYSVDEFCERKTSIQRDDYDERVVGFDVLLWCVIWIEAGAGSKTECDMDHGVSQNKDIQTPLIHFQTSLTTGTI